jgi:hypothetical protein
LRTKALYFVQPRSEKFRNLPTKATQIDCILFSRAEGIATKRTVFCSAAQRRFRNCDQTHCICSAVQRKKLNLFRRAAKFFGIANQKSTPFCSTAQQKDFELPTRALHFLQSRSENFGIFPQNQLKTDCILFSRAAKFLEFSTKPTQTDCILFCRAAKNSVQAPSEIFWDLPTKAKLYFVLPCSENFGICQQKQLLLTRPAGSERF